MLTVEDLVAIDHFRWQNQGPTNVLEVVFPSVNIILYIWYIKKDTSIVIQLGTADFCLAYEFFDTYL
jgi:hypothetical protein